jgi:hypothetical protein
MGFDEAGRVAYEHIYWDRYGRRASIWHPALTSPLKRE